MKPIAVFFHGLFVLGDPPKPLDNAINIIKEQMQWIGDSGLLKAASELHVGINGSIESEPIAEAVLPYQARVTYHGLQSRAENLTVVMVENWVKTHPGWGILYLHSKSSTHSPESDYGKFATAWRRGMMEDLVTNWRTCVEDLETHDIVCSHWMWNMADGTQHIPAGNFLWVTSDFVAKLPSIYLRDRIKLSGIDALESRFESEVFWGNGPRPTVKQFRPQGGGGVP